MDMSLQSPDQVLNYIYTNIRYMFYLVSPEETMRPDIKDVPRYVVEIFPFFFLMGFLENVCLFIKRGSLSRLNDNVASLSQGIFQECLRSCGISFYLLNTISMFQAVTNLIKLKVSTETTILLSAITSLRKVEIVEEINIRSVEVVVYVFFYNNYRLCTLPWDSRYTWFLCFIAIDLGFYWAHRIAHEVNFVWAIHQAHHSGEDFTMTSALRQAVLQPFTAWFTYVPLAMSGIPPSIFLAHLQLGELYMFWIHTEVLSTLGPLEYILNTPSHHRVHHGRNPKYIDKNYAGVLIVWDFMFGTFQKEDLEDPPIYGLVHPVSSYNPFYLQYHHWVHMFNYAKSLKSWKHRLMVPFMGPGWQPGKPRLGLYEEIPEPEKPAKLFDPQISLFAKSYVIIHYAMILIFYHELTLRVSSFPQYLVTCGILTLLFSITSVGFILENRWFAPLLEIFRCIAFLFVDQTILKVPEKEFEEFNLEIGLVSQALLWCIVMAYRVADSKFKVTTKLSNKLTKLQKKLIKGLYIRMDEKEFKKVN